MNSRQIQYFLEIVRQSNFTKAAQLLYTSQPSLSRQIANLEEELGVSLFDRSKTGVQLTPMGRKYYELFRKTRQAMDELALEAKRSNEPTVTQLKVGIPEGWDLRKVVERLSQHLSQNEVLVEPEFRSFNYRGMMAQIQSNGLDALIGPTRMVLSMPNLSYAELPAIQNVLIYAQKHAPPENGRYYTVHDFRTEKLLLLGQEESTLIREFQLGYLHAKGLAPACAEYHNIDSILLAVGLDHGFAILDTFSRGIQDVNVNYFPLDLEMPICFAWKKSRDTEAMHLLAECLYLVLSENTV